jgi:quercetin dioxygenase-like cupin family protein
VDEAQAARDRAQIAAVQKAVNETKAVRHTCWELGATDDFDLTGAVALKLKFGDKGQVVQTHVVRDETGDKVLVSCLRDLYSKYRWPPVFRAGDAIQLPFSFQAPRAQYTVRYDRVAAAAAKGAKVGGVLSPKFSAHVLVDQKSTGNGAAAITILTARDGLEVPMHRHSSAELLYVSSGEGRVFGLDGKRRATKVAAGTAIYIPAGTAHGFVHTGKADTVLVQLYAPGGPEQRFKTGNTRGTTPVTAQEQKRRPRRFPRPIVVRKSKVKPLSIAGGKGQVRILLDEARVKDKAAYLGIISMQAGVKIPAHRHAKASELLLMTKGAGVLVVDGKRYPVARGTAIQIPTNIEHAFEATADVEAIQFYSPSGPEQRFRGVTK